MRRTLTAFVFVVASAMIVAAQQGQSGKEPAKPGAAPAPARPATPTDRPSSLRGCISAAPDTNGSFTLTEQGPKGSRFRITGRSMRDFAGKLVEVACGDREPAGSQRGQAGSAVARGSRQSRSDARGLLPALT